VADPEWQAGVLLLALMASGETDNAEVSIATLLTGLGLAVGDGQPIDRRTVTGLIAADVHLLRQLGAFERDRRDGWPSTVTPDGIALARAALNPPEAGRTAELKQLFRGMACSRSERNGQVSRVRRCRLRRWIREKTSVEWIPPLAGVRGEQPERRMNSCIISSD